MYLEPLEARLVPSAPTLQTLVSSGLSLPSNVAVDGAGNVYFADTGNNAIKEYNASTKTVSTLVSSGLNNPQGVAVDGAGNVYIADTGHNVIDVYNPSTHTVSTLVSSGLNVPTGVAVDGAGNVYIADAGNNAIKEYNASTHTVSTLASFLSFPVAVAVDGAGNVYIADNGNNEIMEYNASTHVVSALVSSGLNNPWAVAVDGAGNVYIADAGNNAIEEYNASTHTVSTLVSSGLNDPRGVAVDSAGNVYIADNGNNAIKELVRATPAASASGSDVLLLPMLPTSEPLPAPQNTSATASPGVFFAPPPIAYLAIAPTSVQTYSGSNESSVMDPPEKGTVSAHGFDSLEVDTMFVDELDEFLRMQMGTYAVKFEREVLTGASIARALLTGTTPGSDLLAQGSRVTPVATLVLRTSVIGPAVAEPTASGVDPTMFLMSPVPADAVPNPVPRGASDTPRSETETAPPPTRSAGLLGTSLTVLLGLAAGVSRLVVRRRANQP